MELKVVTQTKDGILVVDCIGRIVFGEESSLLRDTVKKAISQNNRIVLNLGEVSYIDSGGLGTLVALRTTAQNAGGTIKLTNLTKRVGDLLQVTKLLTVFDVYNSEAEAIDSFRKAAYPDLSELHETALSGLRLHRALLECSLASFLL